MVDDEPSIRRLIARSLEPADVIEASDGSEALTALEADAGRFCAIVCDLTLPGVSGEEVIRTARAVRPDLRVVVMTGRDVETAAELLGQVGPVEWLQKPFTFADLRAALAGILPAA